MDFNTLILKMGSHCLRVKNKLMQTTLETFNGNNEVTLLATVAFRMSSTKKNDTLIDCIFCLSCRTNRLVVNDNKILPEPPSKTARKTRWKFPSHDGISHEPSTESVHDECFMLRSVRTMSFSHSISPQISKCNLDKTISFYFCKVH